MSDFSSYWAWKDRSAAPFHAMTSIWSAPDAETGQ